MIFVFLSARGFQLQGRTLPPEKISISFRGEKGPGKKEFTIYRTHHGPVISQRDGKWISVKLMQEPLKALTQSYLRTKAGGFVDFKKIMDLKTNSSNNTVFADDKGNIAYWHGDFIPIRDPKFDWSKPVDGSNPATEWNGLHEVDDIVHSYNPPSGWIQNCNSTPFTVAGPSSPDQKKYPSYMAPDVENTRGLHAVRVLRDESAFTLDKLIAAAYDPYLPGFEKLLPSMLNAYENAAMSNDTLRAKYDEPIQMLKQWDLRWATSSIPTTLAIFWALRLRQDVTLRIPAGTDQLSVISFLWLMRIVSRLHLHLRFKNTSCRRWK